MLSLHSLNQVQLWPNASIAVDINTGKLELDASDALSDPTLDIYGQLFITVRCHAYHEYDTQHPSKPKVLPLYQLSKCRKLIEALHKVRSTEVRKHFPNFVVVAVLDREIACLEHELPNNTEETLDCTKIAVLPATSDEASIDSTNDDDAPSHADSNNKEDMMAEPLSISKETMDVDESITTLDDTTQITTTTGQIQITSSIEPSVPSIEYKVIDLTDSPPLSPVHHQSEYIYMGYNRISVIDDDDDDNKAGEENTKARDDARSRTGNMEERPRTPMEESEQKPLVEGKLKTPRLGKKRRKFAIPTVTSLPSSIDITAALTGRQQPPQLLQQHQYQQYAQYQPLQQQQQQQQQTYIHPPPPPISPTPAHQFIPITQPTAVAIPSVIRQPQPFTAASSSSPSASLRASSAFVPIPQRGMQSAAGYPNIHLHSQQHQQQQQLYQPQQQPMKQPKSNQHMPFIQPTMPSRNISRASSAMGLQTPSITATIPIPANFLSASTANQRTIGGVNMIGGGGIGSAAVQTTSGRPLSASYVVKVQAPTEPSGPLQVSWNPTNTHQESVSLQVELRSRIERMLQLGLIVDHQARLLRSACRLDKNLEGEIGITYRSCRELLDAEVAERLVESLEHI
jgi:hypothetical protein